MSGDKSGLLSRRQFLSRCLQTTAGCLIAQSSVARGLSQYMHHLNERQLSFFHLRTGEKLKTAYWADGHYLDDGLSEINHLLRDFRQNEVAAMDPLLLDQLFSIQRILANSDTIQVISGYRTEKTNNMLVQQKRGAVKNSFHTLGRAIDLNIAGVALKDLREAALLLRAGGVGYYPRSQFIHLDTGPVRTW